MVFAFICEHAFSFDEAYSDYIYTNNDDFA